MPFADLMFWASSVSTSRFMTYFWRKRPCLSLSMSDSDFKGRLPGPVTGPVAAVVEQVAVTRCARCQVADFSVEEHLLGQVEVAVRGRRTAHHEAVDLLGVGQGVTRADMARASATPMPIDGAGERDHVSSVRTRRRRGSGGVGGQPPRVDERQPSPTWRASTPFVPAAVPMTYLVSMWRTRWSRTRGWQSSRRRCDECPASARPVSLRRSLVGACFVESADLADAISNELLSQLGAAPAAGRRVGSRGEQMRWGSRRNSAVLSTVGAGRRAGEIGRSVVSTAFVRRSNSGLTRLSCVCAR